MWNVLLNSRRLNLKRNKKLIKRGVKLIKREVINEVITPSIVEENKATIKKFANLENIIQKLK